MQRFGEQILFKPHKTAEPLQKLAVNWFDGCWLGYNTRTGEHIASNHTAVVTGRSIQRRNKEERWNRAVLLGVLGNLWSLKVDLNPAAPGGYIPMVNPEVEAEPTVTKTRNEEHGRRIYINKKRGLSLERHWAATVVFWQVNRTWKEMPSKDHCTNGKRPCTCEASRRQLGQESWIRQT